jgi:hypothetical protein
MMEHWNIRKVDWFLVVVLIIAAVLRCLAVVAQGLPTGDEINCYINNAQQFARHGRIPSLSDHPGVAIIYGCLTALLDRTLLTLSGVVAAKVVIAVSGILTAFFIYRAVERFVNRRTAFLASLLWVVFPGSYFAIRGDLALYALFLSALLFCLTRFSDRFSLGLAILTGGIACCFYLSRSDGLFISLLTITAGAVLEKNIRRAVPVMLVSFMLFIGLFLVVRHGVMGRWGALTSTRAFDAFYQAEGLHDGKGGSWQDYTARGLERYGPPKKYSNSMARLLFSNRQAVVERVRANWPILCTYTKWSINGSPVIAGLIILGVFLWKPGLRAFLLFAFPCIATSMIYMVYYFQETYFVLLSFGLTLAMALGLVSLIEFAGNRMNRKELASVVLCLAAAFLVMWTGWCTARMVNAKFRQRDTPRYWNALVFLREKCAVPRTNFFASDYQGSRAMYIYVDGGDPGVAKEDVLDKTGEDLVGFLNHHCVKFVLAQKENPQLWDGIPSDLRMVAFQNKAGDVRVLELKDN